MSNELSTRGWVVLESYIPMHLVEWMRVELAEAYERCRAIQIRNGVAFATEHTIHHLVGQGQSWLELLRQMPNKQIEEFFSGPFILNSMGGNINPKSAENYAAHVHRDIRSYLEDKVMLNTIVALDDMTTENGATWLMHRGHRYSIKPSNALFEAHAEQVCAPAGSVIMFESRTWHKAGVNTTDKARRIVTPMYTKPFYKPQFDYCRVVDAGSMDETLKQILGYYARVPATLDEWYQPPERRAYRASQG